ncbi:MAG: 50S ribosomal protein L4 [Victivallaceae bacterium]|nr:50S ribosomal protein L4 [Victivallaceae bacterium]
MAKILQIVDCNAAVVGEYALPDNCFELEQGSQAVHECVVGFLAGQRAGTACTKTRGEVSGGGAKPFRQKGLGRARAGSSRSPLWTGGGVIFGPAPRSYAKKINKKVRQLALKRAFSERVEEDSVIVLDKIEFADGKTKSVKALLNALQLTGTGMIVVPEYTASLIKATGNLDDVVLRKAASVNVYELLRFSKLIFAKESLDILLKRMN